ncbi:hypothetical protein FACS1894163_13620 [Spirochaetia bacterium]|nr:hypothetical protein FACS1894163_13620 [Spirochaetia bacterium]
MEKDTDTFIRYNEGTDILKKVRAKKENSIREQISSRKPFGLDTTFKGKEKPFKDSILLYQNGGIGYIAKSEILTNCEIVKKYKVFIPRSGSGSDSFPHPILGKPFFDSPQSYIEASEYILKNNIFRADFLNNIEMGKVDIIEYLEAGNFEIERRFYKFTDLYPKEKKDRDLFDEYNYSGDRPRRIMAPCHYSLLSRGV